MKATLSFFGAKFHMHSALSFYDYHKIRFRCLLVHYVVGRKTWKSSYLHNSVLEGLFLKISIVVPSFTCSQIWLFPLVDGCQCFFFCVGANFGDKKKRGWRIHQKGFLRF